MSNYGLSEYQIKKSKEKLDNNIDFMHNNGVQVDNKIVPYAVFVQNSYINPDRYIAEIQHRAWSMFEYANIRDLKNIMFTLTLPTEWHPKKTVNGKLVTNPKFGGRSHITTINNYRFINCHVFQNIPYVEPILDFSLTVDKYTPRNASSELSKMLKNGIFNDRAYRSIEKNNRCYFRVTEPHKDGTPHIHMSLFIPEDKKERIIKALKRLYPEPLGQVETNIKKPVHYLMKYVLKTFDDLRTTDNISNLTLWYLYHGISRFYTSRTFISLDIYRRLNGMYGLKELTKKFRDDEIRVYIYKDTNKISLIENEFGSLYVPKPINWEQKENDKLETVLSECGNFNIPIETSFETVYKDIEPKRIPVTYDGVEYSYYKGRFTKLKKMPYQMNHLELYNYFEKLDIETVDYKHYIYTRNLLIKKGLIVGERLNLAELECEGEIF